MNSPLGVIQRNFRYSFSLQVVVMIFKEGISISGSREASFVYAISAAGVVHTVTRACSKGHLHFCACDPTKRGIGRDRRGTFDWGGCSDNVHYGSRFSRVFIDAKDRRISDARALMNLHNNRAGRRVSSSFTVIVLVHV